MAQSLVEIFACHASDRPDRSFLREHDTGRSLTYREAQTRVASAAHHFKRQGLQNGDRLALLLENRLEWVTTFLAAQLIGAIVVPLNTRLTGQEVQMHIEDCDPRIIVVDQNYESVLSQDDPRLIRYWDVPTEGHANVTLTAKPDDPAMITYTSGTTGSPKGVVLSHRAINLSSVTYAAIFNSDPDFATAIAVPLFHNTGFIDGLGHAIIAGGSVEIFRRFEAPSLSQGLSQERYSFFIGVPTMYRRILEYTTASPIVARSRPLWLAYGGAPMPASVAQRLFERFSEARLVNCYGMSEATSITHYLPAHLSSGRWDSVGIPVPGTVDRISDTDELEVNSPTAMLGYWRRDQVLEFQGSPSWIRTGDCATRDALGLVRITGRADDIINRGGEKIAPFQVESAISQLEGIMDVVIIGVHDPDLGQVPAALIVTRDDNFNVEAIKTALADEIADFKIPTRIYRVDEIPRNANGKVNRAQVRQIVAQRMDEGCHHET